MNHTRPRAARPARWSALAALLLPFWLGAAELYQAAVPVSGSGVEERNQAIGEALKAVLVKLSGRRSSADGETAQSLAARAPNLVQQYRYETLPGTGKDTESPLRLLQVRFDGASLRQSLREQGMPVWSGARPSVLLWLGLEERAGRRFLQPEADAALKAAAEAVADRRGLPFLFPLLDMEDFSRLSPSDLWGGFDERLRDASRRYSADLVLVGRLSPAGRSWLGRWQLLDGADSFDWQLRAGDAEAALQAGLQEAVDRIAERYAPAIPGGDLAQSTVLVRGVHGLAAVKTVERLLGSLDTVQKIALTRVEPDRIWLRLDLAGGTDAVVRGAALGGQLSVVATPPALPGAAPLADPAAPPPDLVFVLRP